MFPISNMSSAITLFLFLGSIILLKAQSPIDSIKIASYIVKHNIKSITTTSYWSHYNTLYKTIFKEKVKKNYNRKGEEEGYIYENQEGTIIKKMEPKYDDKNRLVELIYYEIGPQSIAIPVTLKYYYDELNRLIEIFSAYVKSNSFS